MGRALAYLLVVALAALAVGAPRPAVADQPPSQRILGRLAKGRRLFQELEYRAAIRDLQPLRTDGAASRAQRLSALEIIGISHLILGEKAPAIEAFEDLLAIDPGYQLQEDDGSPKIRQFFEDVRAAYVPGFDRGAEVRLEHAVPPGATAARRVEVEAVVKAGLGKVKEMVLRWRRRGVLSYEDAPMRAQGGGRYRGAFTPPASRTRYVVDYYVEAKNVAGGALGRIGGPENPLALEVAPGTADERPWYGRWYVVTGGAVTVGLASALLYVALSDGTGDGSLEPGRVTLTP